MNKTDIEPLFPERLTDEAASVLSSFLYDLAAACENRYFTQLRRYHESQRIIHDPERPWRSQSRDR